MELVKQLLQKDLAHLINEDNVSDIIKEHTVYSLDIGALLAGTKSQRRFKKGPEVLEILEAKEKTIPL